MKIIRLFISFVVAIGFMQFGMPTLVKYVEQFVKEKELPEEVVEVSSLFSEHRLKTMFSYLPFIGIAIKDVAEIKEPIVPANEALSFTYHDNSFLLYQVDGNNATIKQIKEELAMNYVSEINNRKYVGVMVSEYLVLVDEVKDFPKLIESLKEVNTILESIGFEKVSLKFE